MRDETKFTTKFDDHGRILSHPGVGVKDNFVGRYDDHGRVVLEPSGQTDMYAFIQSHADSVDINILLQRYKNGEIDVLNKVQSYYADITDLPKTFADVLNTVKAGEDAFAALPVETRALFNHSMSEWLATMGSKDWCDKMDLEYVEPEPPKKKSKKKAVAVPDPVSDPVSASEVTE